MNEVQSVINNISFPKSLEEVLQVQMLHGHFDVEEILIASELSKDENDYCVEWTMPKWCKTGDIVFFMHAKNARAIISRLNTELRESNGNYSENDHCILRSSLLRGRELHKKYGGKIFAIGKVCGNALSFNMDYNPHWRSRVYAPIDSLYCLQQPIDISEFNNFIQLSRQSAITPVFGKEFESLKSLIMSKNTVPSYLEESVSMPIPLSKITQDNWIQVASRYRRSFFLEIQFRSYYVDHLLECLGDRKGFFKECACVKGGQKASFVDNVIVIDGKYLPVEVKLNVDTEKSLIFQLHKYCALDSLTLDAKRHRDADPEKVYGNGLLVIDTNSVFWYDDCTQFVHKIWDLDNISGPHDIINLREKIISLMR